MTYRDHSVNQGSETPRFPAGGQPSPPSQPDPVKEPALAELEQLLKELTGDVATHLRDSMPPGVGFTLLIFSLGRGPGGWSTYASNANRGHMLEALREFMANVADNSTVAERIAALASRLQHEVHGARLDKLITREEEAELARALDHLVDRVEGDAQ